MLAYATKNGPGGLLLVGVICAVFGVRYLKRGIEGDTLMPGTSFTYIPRWLMISFGLVLLTPLPAAIWFLKEQGFL